MSIRSAGQISYDHIGHHYAVGRRTDPRIAARIWAALGGAQTVLNVGAGTGSYEPPDRDVTAVEPSGVMRGHRSARAAPCIAAAAEVLPFADKSFDAAMAVLSDHHWRDPLAGLKEMRRVAHRVIVFQWDFLLIPCFWLVRDYLPEYATAVRDVRPTLLERAEVISARIESVPIPWDCSDGFFHATGAARARIWRRGCAARHRCGHESDPTWSAEPSAH
jgi:SAM-dependent methyltransferase